MNAYQKGQKLLMGAYSEYTPTGKGYFTKNKKYGKTPRRGDIVYFYRASMGRVCHVGLVVDVTGSQITTIEGNTAAGKVFARDGGEVAEKHYALTDASIDGYGTPAYGDDTCTVSEMIMAAERWLSYAEKASNGTDEQLKSKTWNPGDKNFTWFGRWYGDNGAYWCQQFISCVAYEACAGHADQRSVKTGWVQDGEKWTYIKDDGKAAADEWVSYGGRWYVFDHSGCMITGWFKDGHDWYYLAGDGAMVSGQWVCDKDKQYYMTASGTMAADAYIRSDKPYADGKYIYYYVNPDGEWDTARDVDAMPSGAEVAE